MKSMERRHFLQFAGLGATMALTGFSYNRQAKSNLLRLGGPVFLKSEDPAELAAEHRRLGYSAAYVPDVNPGDSGKIRELRKAFADRNVMIAEVGAWVNMLDSDIEKRAKNLDYVIQRLALAEEIGALNCVNIGGSYNTKQWDGPDPRNLTKEYFDATVENCRKVIDAVKPKTAKFSLEMMGWSLPDGPDSYLKFIKAIDRPAFGAHVDIANILNSPERFYKNKTIIDDTFKKLGRYITSCHAKDLIGKDVHLAETMPGKGGIDYETYIRNVVALPRPVPFMLEHLRTPEEYDEARKFVVDKAGKMGVQLA
ncbi:sugar phosphate isomerase/epimerase family protein [Dyadobacter psychrotolerans]|uniref:Sugar phosphate isomerase/epimerase n=1 Tax=Dyadobacter psychrotolerans TaxID=2541721 RepID=A0A4R5DM47_9BACT|nr:sugar phosphate isomerase/epimerase [Dyadobacter psychrotolerans]TDE15342.1 sugar phosphate isomerase/epimerase [Dyadobacter psychrotolerans]